MGSMVGPPLPRCTGADATDVAGKSDLGLIVDHRGTAESRLRSSEIDRGELSHTAVQASVADAEELPAQPCRGHIVCYAHSCYAHSDNPSQNERDNSVPVMFPHGHGGTATENVLVGTARSRYTNSADESDAVDNRQGTANGHDVSMV